MNADRCCRCPKAVIRARGLCSTCYDRALKLVQAHKTTWRRLERLGHARPPNKLNQRAWLAGRTLAKRSVAYAGADHN